MVKRLLSGFAIAAFPLFPLTAMEKTEEQAKAACYQSWTALPREVNILILKHLIALYEQDYQLYFQSKRKIDAEKHEAELKKENIPDTRPLLKALKDQIFGPWKTLGIYENIRNYLSISRKCIPWRGDKDFMKPLIEGVNEQRKSWEIPVLPLHPEEICKRFLETNPNIHKSLPNLHMKYDAEMLQHNTKMRVYNAKIIVRRIRCWHMRGAIEWAKHFFIANPDLFQYIQEQINISGKTTHQDPDFYCFPEPWLDVLQQVGFTIPFLTDGNTSLMRAAQKGCDYLGRILGLKCCDVNQEDKNGNNALLLALLAGKDEDAAYLIENCPEINAKHVNKAGDDALWLAGQPGEPGLFGSVKHGSTYEQLKKVYKSVDPIRWHPKVRKKFTLPSSKQNGS